MTEGGPRVTVVIPFLDPPSDYFRAAIDSVIAQTCSDWELLLVNDGSGPEASGTAREAAVRDPVRIRCIAHADGKNHGIAASRNCGLAVARGQYIASLDADDVWLSSKLADQVALLDMFPHVDLVFGRSVYWRSWDRSGPVHGDDFIPPLRVPDGTQMGGPDFVQKLIGQELMVPCPSSILARADTVREVGGYGEGVSNLFEDQAFYTKIGLNGTMLARDTVWDHYRIHEASVLGSASSQQSCAARRQFLDWVEDYLSTHGACNTKLRRTIGLERWALDHPHGARALRGLRKIRSRWSPRSPTLSEKSYRGR